MLILPRRKFLLGLGAGICAPYIVRAQTLLQTGAGSTKKPSAGGAFTGPGDIVASAFAWWGLRAYNAASIGSNCIDIKRASDSTTQTFVTLASGLVDTASITTFLAATTGVVQKLYDQTGNGRHMTLGTTAPAFGLSVLGSNPAIQPVALNTPELTTASVSLAQPYTESFVFNRTSVSGGDGILLGNTGVSTFTQSQAANTWRMFAGAALVETVSDNTTHALNCVYNGASSDFNIDGTSNTGNAGTSGFSSEAMWLFGVSNSFQIVGNFFEGGVWPIAFSSGQSSSMSSNQHAFWGF